MSARTVRAALRSWLRARRAALLLWGATLAILGLFPFALLVYPALFIGPAQPIPFSHHLHAGVKEIDCRFCHPHPERSPRAGLPEVGKCLFCHRHVIPEHPEIRKIHEHFERGEPIPWKRLVYLPDHVSFAHPPHIQAGLECAECHGAVETFDRIPATEFLMGRCVECHRTRGAELGCWLACHR